MLGLNSCYFAWKIPVMNSKISCVPLPTHFSECCISVRSHQGGPMAINITLCRLSDWWLRPHTSSLLTLSPPAPLPGVTRRTVPSADPCWRTPAATRGWRGACSTCGAPSSRPMRRAITCWPRGAPCRLHWTKHPKTSMVQKLKEKF